MSFLRLGLILVVVALKMSVGKSANLVQDLYEYYPSSCEGLSDGYHFLKLTDGDNDEYPLIYGKCSNDYLILDYSVDSDITNYFSSWDTFYRHYYGPTNDEHITWQEWYLPSKKQIAQDASSSSSSLFSFMVSPDCNSCDDSSDINQFYKDDSDNPQSTYWMSGNLFGCFWEVKGSPNFEQEWDSELCYYYAGSSGYKIGIFEESDRVEVDDYGKNSATSQGKTGTCAHIVRSSHSEVPLTHSDCVTDPHGSVTQFKPSIGTNGKYCVCVKPERQEYHLSSTIKEREKQIAVGMGLDKRETMRQIHDGPETGESGESGESGTSDDKVNIKLYQSDFEKGTYRITKAGTYTIMEDILFNFGFEKDYWPTSDDSDMYPGAGEYKGSFSQGWFAGITIECDDVILDLNSFALGQSNMFYFEQRWFTVIEIGSQSFLPGEGVYNAGSNPIFSKNIVIKNGKLGPTSHHGIHGNCNENVLIENIHIFGFETHGIQLNGFKNIQILKTEIGPSSQDVYFTGRYGHGKAGLGRYKTVAEEADDNDTPVYFYGRNEATTMGQIVNEMELQLDYALTYAKVAQEFKEDELNENGKDEIMERVTDLLGIKSIEKYGDPDKYADELERLKNSLETFVAPWDVTEDGFGSPNGAAQYGIFLNTYGASIFTYNLYVGIHSENAYLENIKIHGLTHKMYHVHFIVSGGILMNHLGLMLDGESVFNNFNDWENTKLGLTYKGNILTDAAILADKLSDNWSLLSTNLVDFISDFAFGNKLSTDTIAFNCNTDTMVHAGKGTQALRIDGVDNVNIKNIEIYDNHDYTELENTDCQSINDNSYEGETHTMCLYDNDNKEICSNDEITIMMQTHILQNEPMQHGFSGNVNQGININAATNVVIENAKIYDLTSKTGAVYGISIWPADQVTLLGNIDISNLHAGYNVDSNKFEYNEYPNQAAEVCGVRNYDEKDDLVSIIDSENAVFSTKCLIGNIGCLGDALNVNAFDDSIELIKPNNVNDGNNQIINECNVKYHSNDNSLLSFTGYHLNDIFVIIVGLSMFCGFVGLNKFYLSKKESFKYHQIP